MARGEFDADGPVLQAGGCYTFFVDREPGKIVLGMTSFEVREARKLAARIIAECDKAEERSMPTSGDSE